MVLVQALHELSHGNIGIIAAHQVDIDVVGAPAVQRFDQLRGHKFRGAMNGGSAFADKDNSVTDGSLFDPGSPALFGAPTPINPCGVNTVSTALEEAIEQRKRKWQPIDVEHHRAQDNA